MEDLTFAEKIVMALNKDEERKNMIEIQNHNDIASGSVIIDKQRVEFEVRFLMEKRAKMSIPRKSGPMDNTLIQAKYPAKDRPEWIYTLNNPSFDMTATLSNEKSRDEDTEQIKNNIITIMRTLYPINEIKDNGTIKPFEKAISYFTFDLPLYDGVICQMMYFTIHHTREMIGTFSCPRAQGEEWRPIWIQMLHTLKTGLSIG